MARGQVLTSEEERRREIQWKRGFTGIPRSSLCINGRGPCSRFEGLVGSEGSEEEDGEEREVAAGADEGMARRMAWRRETVVGAVYTATGETHFVHRSGIYI